MFRAGSSGRLYAMAFSAFILGPGGLLMGSSYDHFHPYRQGLLLFVGMPFGCNDSSLPAALRAKQQVPGLA